MQLLLLLDNNENDNNYHMHVQNSMDSQKLYTLYNIVFHTGTLSTIISFSFRQVSTTPLYITIEVYNRTPTVVV